MYTPELYPGGERYTCGITRVVRVHLWYNPGVGYPRVIAGWWVSRELYPGGRRVPVVYTRVVGVYPVYMPVCERLTWWYMPVCERLTWWYIPRVVGILPTIPGWGGILPTIPLLLPRWYIRLPPAPRVYMPSVYTTNTVMFEQCMYRF